MEKKLSKPDLEKLALGCCFFASGGGGSLSSGLNLLKEFKGTAPLVSKEEAVADEKSYTLVVAYIGAPDAIEDLGKPVAAMNAFNLMNKAIGQKIKYVVPVEQGALSTIVSCVVANELNLKVIDGDGAGRAVPELTMLTYANIPMISMLKDSYGNIIPSAILASKDNQRIAVLVNSPATVEAIARPFISAGINGFDQAAGLAIWLMDSKTLDTALTITGTVSLSLQLGEKIKGGLGDNPYQTVIEFLQSHGLHSDLLFTGKMTLPTETTSGGFDLDKVVIKGANGVDMHIYAQNENLIAWRTDKTNPVIIAPDSICYLSIDGRVFSNADIAKTKDSEGFVGKEVGVIAILSRGQLTSDKNIMASFDKALTNIGYPSLYIPWTKN